MINHLRTVIVGLAAVTVASAPLAAQNAPVKVDPNIRAQVIQILKNEPELVLIAAQAAQDKQRNAQQAAQNARVEGSRSVLLGAANFGPVLGNPKGKVVAAEFLDYRCGYCKRANPLIESIIAGNKDVRFIAVMRPVLGPDSETLARFALAASLQGKFAQVHHALYEKFGGQPNPANDDNLRAIAAQTGLDFDRAKKDMTGDEVVAILEKHQKMAEQLAVNGTPFFVTEKTVMPGAPRDEAQLKAALGL